MKTPPFVDNAFFFVEQAKDEPKPKAKRLPTIPEAKSKRDKGIRRVAQNAEYNRAKFSEDAQDFIVSFLKFAKDDKASGEDITDVCVNAGIQPHDMRAFGPVFQKLVKAGKIEKTGETCVRRRGNLTTGGNIWRLKA